MTIFRWIMGVLLGLFAAGWLGIFLLYVIRDDSRLAELGTKFRRWTITIALAWFNLEIWGRVIWTIVTWNR
jgi:hypothetical protein